MQNILKGATLRNAARGSWWAWLTAVTLLAKSCRSQFDSAANNEKNEYEK